MSVPRPGQRVRGSRTGRPIMAALDLLGRRWALRVLWELRTGPLPFRALREACDGVSPAVLNTRLAELRDAGLVASTGEGYAVTAIGEELAAALAPLSKWAQRWSRLG
jgi:DNA-binding HxlR family transcriptional regulator